MYRERWGLSAQQSLGTLLMWSCALAVILALTAQAAELGPVSELALENAPSHHLSADDLQQEPWQCEADLSAARIKQATPAEALSVQSRALLSSHQEVLAAQGFFGQSGKPVRTLTQAPVLGGYSPVATSTLPAAAGNLNPLPSGYFLTASPYASPGTSSLPLYLSTPSPPPVSSFPPSTSSASLSPGPGAPVQVSTPAATENAGDLSVAATPPSSVPASTALFSPAVTAATTPAADTSTPTVVTYSSPTSTFTPSIITVSSPVFSPTSAAGSSSVTATVPALSPAAAALPIPASSGTSSAASPASVNPTAATPLSSTPVTSTPYGGPSSASSTAATEVPAPPADSALPLVASLEFPGIPVGSEPFVSCQAIFEQVPSDSLTAAEEAEVAGALLQAIATYLGNTTAVSTAVVPLNYVVYTAPSPSVTRRHLMQASGNTLQATLTFTLTLATTSTGSNAAVESAVQTAVASAVAPLTVTTAAVDVGAGAYNVTVVFPPNNQVSTSASQGTLAGTTFLAILRGNAATALPDLATSIGTFSLTSSQLNVALVTAAPSAEATPAATVTATIPTSSSMTTPEASLVATPTPDISSTVNVVAATPGATAFTAPETVPSVPVHTSVVSPAAAAAAATPVPSAPATATPVAASPALPPAQVTAGSQPSSGYAMLRQPPAPLPSPPPAPFFGDSSTAAPVSPATEPLIYNVSVVFPSSATALAQELANTLYFYPDKALYAVVAANGEVNISNVVYGSQASPVAPAPAPSALLAAAPAAAAAPEAATGAAIESYIGPDAGTGSNTNASGQLYAINMQFGVTGARTNSSVNLLVLSLPVSPRKVPRPTDFTVQLEQVSQSGSVAVLSNWVSDAEFLLQVDCPPAYTGKVTVKYIPDSVPPIEFKVVQSLLLVKVTASSTY